MGLDTSHDCWHGSYTSFMQWRTKLAEAAGYPPLHLMEGFFNPNQSVRLPGLPIKWDILRPDVLTELLSHSDCYGSLSSGICEALADRLEELLPFINETPTELSWREITKEFIAGLRTAAAAGEDVEFH